MNNPPDDQQQSLDEIFNAYHAWVINHHDSSGVKEPTLSTFQAKQGIVALVESAKLKKSYKAQRAYQIDSNDFAAVVKEKARNQGIDAQMQAILKVLQGGE